MSSSDHDAVLTVIAQKAQAPLELPPGATALLVIDMQRYFVEPEGRFATLANALSPGAADQYLERVAGTVLPNVRQLVSAFREARLPVFFTGIGTRTGDGRDLAGWLRGFDELSKAVLGSPVWPAVDEADWQIDDELTPSEGETVLQKTTADPFVSTELESELRGSGVEAVVVCGLITDMCVSATARGAADRDFLTVVASDACTTISEDLHRASLEIIGLAFGRVAGTDEITRAISARQRSIAPELVPAR